jgi:two-component system, cell cycle sensor histidine kinase and response regulator CckA
MKKSIQGRLSSAMSFFIPLDSPRKKKRILLVEDDAVVREVLVQVLTNHDFEVLEAADGVAGLEVLKTHSHLDMLLSDIVMPHIQGPELCRQARKAYPDLRIILMSGYPLIDLEEEIPGYCNAFISKPFRMTELLETIQRLLSEQTFSAEQASQRTQVDSPST